MSSQQENAYQVLSNDIVSFVFKVHFCQPERPLICHTDLVLFFHVLGFQNIKTIGTDENQVLPSEINHQNQQIRESKS